MNEENAVTCEVHSPQDEDEFIHTLSKAVQKEFEDIKTFLKDYQNTFLELERSYATEEFRREKLDATEKKVVLSEKQVLELMEITGLANSQNSPNSTAVAHEGVGVQSEKESGPATAEMAKPSKETNSPECSIVTTSLTIGSP